MARSSSVVLSWSKCRLSAKYSDKNIYNWHYFLQTSGNIFAILQLFKYVLKLIRATIKIWKVDSHLVILHLLKFYYTFYMYLNIWQVIASSLCHKFL